MTLNVFGPLTKDDIKVSYIDASLGLVSDVSIAQANQYVLTNPATTFIFQDGNKKFRYLNIDEVNKLTSNDLLSTDPCGGAAQQTECGPPVIEISGGNGIGAAGNPIIGTDGALLAVDIVSGGYGYQYPPLVTAKDHCNNGAGATLIPVLSEDILNTSGTPSIFINELIPRQVGPGQVGPGQVGPGQVGPGQVGPGQVGPGQVGPGQVGPGQVGPGQVGPREVSGKGVVVEIVVTDPGNGYLSPTPPIPPIEVLPTPANPPSGAPTGINATFLPQFEVVRDPIVVDPQRLLQVTDLVGLRQTGYVNGRAYYGSVYYDNGIRYAGFYQTAGEPVRVYDTLRESITQQATTPPSAILRQGTDIRNNGSELIIPGTIQSTLNSNSIIGAGDISTPLVPFITEPTPGSLYPVSLRLKRVLVEDEGINYNVTDKIRITPSNGAILEPIFGSFGRVIKVAVIDPGFGFTDYPTIEMYTPL
jgi:hypothetical protein